MIDFDVILKNIGGLGRYQLLIVLAVGSNSLHAGYNNFAPVFLNLTPDYRCKVSANCTENLDNDGILNLTTPWTDGKYETCKRYQYNNATNVTLCNERCDCFDWERDPVPCDEGYFYDTSIVSQSVTTEFDLICDRSYLSSLATSVYLAGVLIGSLVLGNIADRFGRRNTMIVCTSVGFFAKLGCAFVHDYWLFVVCRFIIAFCGGGMYLSIFVYILEITSSRWRTTIGLGFQIGFAFGYMILSGFAYQWRNWHQLQLALALFSLPHVMALFIAPKSPRWLFSNNKTEEGKEVVRKFAKYNKVVLQEPLIWEKAERPSEAEIGKTTKKYSTLDLFRTSGIRVVTCLLIFNWFVNGLVYYGISLNVGELNGDVFINNVLGGVMEIVAYIVVMPLVDKVGRKIMLVIMMATAGLTLVGSTVAKEYSNSNKDMENLSLAFGLMAKIGISGSFALIYNFTTELIPTVVRSNGVAVGSFSAQLGSTISPFLLGAQTYKAWLPNVIFVVLCLLGAILSLFFPETRGINMIESIEDAEVFYAESKKFCYKRREVPESSTMTSSIFSVYENPSFENDVIISKL